MDEADNISAIAEILAEAIADKDLPKFREEISQLDTEEKRKAVGRWKIDAVFEQFTLLGLAVKLRQIEMMRILLEECEADVEQHSQFIAFGSQTPLYTAVQFAYPDFNVVKCLVDHGAIVDAPSGDEVSTPLLRLCSGRVAELPTVRYLVEHGADVNKQGQYGETCVMCCIYRFPKPLAVCQYLLENGASVNAVDKVGSSALHYVTYSKRRYSRLPVVQLLLEHGADLSVRNHAGDDLLQAAALYGTQIVLDMFVSLLKPTMQRLADLYSLAANQSENMNDPSYLERSVATRKEVPEDELTAGIVWKNPDPVFQDFVEVHDDESLVAVQHNADAMFMQALASRFRILGRSHAETIHLLSAQAAEYVIAEQYDRGMEMYRYAAASLDACPRTAIVVHPHLIFYRAMWTRYLEDPDSVTFDEATYLLKMVTKMVDSGTTIVSESEDYEMFYVLGFVIIVVDLLGRLKSSEAEHQALEDYVRVLDKSARQATPRHRNLLHLAMGDTAETRHRCFFQEVVPTMPNYGVLEELLNAGVAVNGVDKEGNTPLHLLLMNTPESSEREECLLMMTDLLLRHGAHIDIRNEKGEIPADKLPDAISKHNYIRLECLAARAVRRHGIAYRGILSAKQAAFVNLH